jgi:hypothetical protein
VRRGVNFGKFRQSLFTVLYTDHKKFSVETDSAITLLDPGR